MFPWDDRGDGHPSDTTLLNTLAPVLVAHGLLTHVYLSHTAYYILMASSFLSPGLASCNCRVKTHCQRPSPCYRDIIPLLQGASVAPWLVSTTEICRDASDMGSSPATSALA
ncbi:hypothetical protein PoB_005233700 [Plakobranchus ocellatus]|uniref:Uncharacterized protein n=1 Tax=Plakobranchus ocellatus TaxID=259542 RepID=A0AAV4C3K9_9GAST|nr:hypothetical protein PoB_005233700 [Plakobranchus ocellatus]